MIDTDPARSLGAGSSSDEDAIAQTADLVERTPVVRRHDGTQPGTVQEGQPRLLSGGHRPDDPAFQVRRRSADVRIDGGVFTSCWET
jgi:hypothetical protein